jgi:hypothetical protein
MAWTGTTLPFYRLPNYMEQNPSWEVTVPQLGNKCPAFYGTWWFMTVLTRAHHLSLYLARRIQCKPLHPTHPFWHYPPSLLHHVVPPKFCTHFSSPLHIPHPLPNQNKIHYKNTKIKSQTKTITHTCASSILLQMNCRIGITSLKHDTPEPPSQLAPVRFKFLSSSWDSSSAQTQE